MYLGLTKWTEKGKVTVSDPGFFVSSVELSIGFSSFSVIFFCLAWSQHSINIARNVSAWNHSTEKNRKQKENEDEQNENSTSKQNVMELVLCRIII